MRIINTLRGEGNMEWFLLGSMIIAYALIFRIMVKMDENEKRDKIKYDLQNIFREAVKDVIDKHQHYIAQLGDDISELTGKVHLNRDAVEEATEWIKIELNKYIKKIEVAPDSPQIERANKWVNEIRAAAQKKQKDKFKADPL